ncbi:MAG: AI-2E family transporter [Deltaproteobacteria bacterium]|nr:AI-2E family transporter [Deltaproteobacteria bacterium]
MNQNWLATIFFFVLLLALLVLAFLIISPFIKALAWAAILAVIVYPGYAWLLKILRGKASLAALAVTVLISLVIVFPALKLVGFLSQEATELIQMLPSLLNGSTMEGWRQNPWVGEILRAWDSASIELAALNISLRQIVLQGAQVSSRFLLAHVKDIAQNVFFFGVNLLITLMTLFFFLRDGKDFCYRLQRLLPMDPEHQERLFKNIIDTLQAVIHGSLIVAAVQGILAGFAYYFLGIPFAILWGVATAFAALIPVGGSTLVTLPASLYLFFQGSYLRGVILLIWSVGIVASIDNILRPLLIGNRIRLSVLFLFFSILGGLALFGALGVILGPVVFALLAAVLELYTQEYAKE